MTPTPNASAASLTRRSFSALSAPPSHASRIVYRCRLIRPSYSTATTHCGPASAARTAREGVVLDEPRRQLQRVHGKREEGHAAGHRHQERRSRMSSRPSPRIRKCRCASTTSPRAASTGTRSARNLASHRRRTLARPRQLHLHRRQPASECAEVEDGAPRSIELALPVRPSKSRHFLRHVWAFDHPVVTEEDRRRTPITPRLSRIRPRTQKG